MVSLVLLVIFSVALFLTNINLIIFVTCSLMSKTFTIAIPNNSSMNGASIATIFCTFGGNSVFSLGEEGDRSVQETERGVT